MPEPKKIQAQVSLDETDREILRLLSTNGRLSNSDLAGQVGLAPSTCLVRVRRLVDEGVIKSFGAEVSPEAIGLELQALVERFFVQARVELAQAIEHQQHTLEQAVLADAAVERFQSSGC